MYLKKIFISFGFEIKLAAILVSLFILLLLYIYIFPPKVQSLYENITNLSFFENIRNELSTGDLIFLSGDTYGEKLIKWWTNSPWNHVGMVIVMPNNDVMLWECDRGQGFKQGVRLVPLSLKLIKWRHGKRIGAWMKSNTHISYFDLKSFIDSKNGKDINTRYYSYLFKKPSISKEKYYCSELIVDTYQYLRMIPSDINGTSVSPNEFFQRKINLDFLNDSILFRF